MSRILEPRLPDGIENEEEIEELPEADKQADPLYGAKIRRQVDNKFWVGCVHEIEMGKVSRERLYRIMYEDGDLEHLTKKDVEKFQVDDALSEETEDDEPAPARKKPAAKEEPAAKAAAKRPAAAEKASAKAKSKAAAKPKAAGKAKAKAKAKAKGKGKATAKAKSKAKAKGKAAAMKGKAAAMKGKR